MVIIPGTGFYVGSIILAPSVIKAVAFRVYILLDQGIHTSGNSLQ